MKLTVSHESVYRFDPPMRGVVQSLRMTPSACENQTAQDWSISVEGATLGAGFRDGAGDWIDTATVLGPVDIVTISVSGTVETRDTGGLLKGHRERIHPRAYLRASHSTKPDVALTELAAQAVSGLPADNVLDHAHALANAVGEAIAYTPGQTQHGTTAAEALAMGQGVCQDHAHALIAVALSVEIPARYVTGYLFSSAEDGMDEASHAWAELWIPDLGWVGFDPANRICTNDQYIRIGSGADAHEAAPIRGVSQGGGEEGLDISVSVTQGQQ